LPAKNFETGWTNHLQIYFLYTSVPKLQAKDRRKWRSSSSSNMQWSLGRWVGSWRTGSSMDEESVLNVMPGKLRDGNACPLGNFAESESFSGF
jgi:hypothetical protein